MRRDFHKFINSEDVVTLSGGARGIDQEVHRTSIACQKPTICFLPSGLAKVYPPTLLNWLEPIVEAGGAIVSQFSPYTKIYKSHFHKRNQLIANLSRATFVVEAKLRSGSMMTANYALEQNKEVATLPWFPMCSSGRGNIKLIQDGAQIITNNDDLKVFWERNKLISSFEHFPNAKK